METCAYCGSELMNNYCSFCEIELTEQYILQDGQRLSNGIDFYPEQNGIFKSTSELLQLETIELLCLLRQARNYRSEVYKLRILTHKAEKEGGDMTAIESKSYSDYEDATRKVWVIENIIKDRVGYYLQKINDEFLGRYLHRIEQSQKKKKIIKKAVTKE